MRNKNCRTSVFRWIDTLSKIFVRWHIAIDIKNTNVYVVYIYNNMVISIDRDVSDKTWNEISNIIWDIVVDIYYNYEWTGSIVNYKILGALLNIEERRVTRYRLNLKRRWEMIELRVLISPMP